MLLPLIMAPHQATLRNGKCERGLDPTSETIVRQRAWWRLFAYGSSRLGTRRH